MNTAAVVCEQAAGWYLAISQGENAIKFRVYRWGHAGICYSNKEFRFRKYSRSRRRIFFAITIGLYHRYNMKIWKLENEKYLPALSCKSALKSVLQNQWLQAHMYRLDILIADQASHWLNGKM